MIYYNIREASDWVVVHNGDYKLYHMFEKLHDCLENVNVLMENI